MEASYSTEVKTTSTETKTKSRPTPDRDETKTLRGWDQVKMKNSTNYRMSSNWSEISTFQEKTPAEDKLNSTPFHCFNFQPTTFLFVWGRDKTDQDRVKMQLSPRRDETETVCWLLRMPINICDKLLPRCLFVGNNYSRAKSTLLKCRAKILYYSTECSHTTVKIHTELIMLCWINTDCMKTNKMIVSLFPTWIQTDWDAWLFSRPEI